MINRCGKGRRRALIFICAASALAFLAGSFWLADGFLIQPVRLDLSVRSLKTTAEPASSAAVSGDRQENGERDAPMNLAALKKVNPDIAGWITVPHTNIDLPVLQAGEDRPDFYLSHDYGGSRSAYGSVYADYRAPLTDPNSKCAVLYGHSLACGRMFTQLDRYKSLDFYRTAPVFSLQTAGGTTRWEVFAVFVANTLPEQGEPFRYGRFSFADDSDFLNFVYQMRIRSVYNTGVSVGAGDRILLLSTCSYEFLDFREVVAAREVRPGESGTVWTARAAYNPKTLYPDCWYRKYGGQKPQWPETYEQALKNGEIF